ncbi:MAG TPA: beta-ketoacyl synthase chain length factor [Candidatus Binatia bacterium]|nr:beta-ketoacyl synthase chain length factor [Candidatus Binatia bacterium]
MTFSGVRFSIASHAAWAPGVETKEAWLAWSKECRAIAGCGEPPVGAMAPLLRRRAGSLNRMALEVAYRCLGSVKDVPTIFASRHGEASRSVDLLLDLAAGQPISPASFGLSVHNATGGLFSIARHGQANDIALAAGQSTVEHAVIEACGLLADGEPRVLLVVYDGPLPAVYEAFQDCREEPFAWAWLMKARGDNAFSLSWMAAMANGSPSVGELPPGLEVLRFYLREDASLERTCDGLRWLWCRDD